MSDPLEAFAFILVLSSFAAFIVSFNVFMICLTSDKEK
ncbi:hypothetical protein LCGC14_0642720 [marine sediment metagenome]|uniref:Uncharacterized protein n=1 Tax=marine sediment metagenome TaxID=412755 RepID=A0A0F9QYR0_9ZZZZ